MRQIRTILALSAVTAVAVTGMIGGATADTPRASDKNIVETAVAAGKFKTLTSLLKRAGLAKTPGKGPYTVFAPTDAAFAKVPDATLARLARNREAALGAAAARRREQADRGQADEATLGEDPERPAARDPRPRRQGLRRRRARRHSGRDRLERRHPRHQQGPAPPLAPAPSPSPGAARRAGRRGRHGHGVPCPLPSPQLRADRRTGPAAEPRPTRARDRRDRVHHGRLAQALAEAGWIVRCLVRDRSRARDLERRGFESTRATCSP